MLKTRIQNEDVEKLKNELSNENEKIKNEVCKMSNEIEYDIFSKTDLRVGEIISAEDIEGADKLLKLYIDLGELGQRSIFAGIKKSYSAEKLIGLKVLVVANLKPKTMRFGVSSGMVLAADSDGDIIVVEANKTIKNGSKVK